MYEMAHRYKFAGLSVENLYGQTEQFTEYVIEEIRKDRFKSEIGDLESRLWLVNYDGKDFNPLRPVNSSSCTNWMGPFEQRHEKTCLCHMRTTKAQISLHIHAV